MILFYFAGVNDALVGIGIYPFIFLFEYAFAAIIFSMAAIFVNNFLNLHEKVENMNVTLEKAVEARTRELKVLSGLMPICASCKKIRDDQGYWNQIEAYLPLFAPASLIVIQVTVLSILLSWIDNAVGVLVLAGRRAVKKTVAVGVVGII